jgi:hypothetical protein
LRDGVGVDARGVNVVRGRAGNFCD